MHKLFGWERLLGWEALSRVLVVAELATTTPGEPLLGTSMLDCGWGGAPPIRRLFRDEGAVSAILEVLGGTRVGKMADRILLVGGSDLEEQDLECVSLQVQGEGEEGTGASSSEEEDGPGPPSGMYLSFVFSLLDGYKGCLFFLLLGGSWGEGVLGYPTMAAQAGPG